MSGWVIDNNSAFLAKDIHSDPRFRKRLFKGVSIKSVLCAPLKAEGVIIGTLLLLNDGNADGFNETDLTYLEKFSTIVSPFLRNVQKIQQYFVEAPPEDALLKKYQTMA